MILQQLTPVPVWGKSNPYERITVIFNGQKKVTAADKSGSWIVTLDKMPASNKPCEMIISGTNTIKLRNILVGEVWLCSGQSNMAYPLKRNIKKYRAPAAAPDLCEEEIKSQKNPEIRLFSIEQNLNTSDVVTKNGWQECNDASIRDCSAAGYFFIKEINEKLHIPVGIISSSFDGSGIDPWIPQSSHMDSPFFYSDSGQAIKTHKNQSDKCWNSMIKPLAPFPIKGFLWYQGETDCMLNNGIKYASKFNLLVNRWRRAWKKDSLPFYFVQISPYSYSKSKKKTPGINPETLPEFWEVQTKTLSIPYTGIVITTDLIDNLSDLHPPYKWEVGRRLSLLALANNYGRKDLISSGPVYKKMKIQKNRIILYFSNCGGGLINKDGKPLSWFFIAGADGKYYHANAVIKENSIVVSAPEIKKPESVRFAWDESARPNLFNREGLPAVPFRTDGHAGGNIFIREKLI